MVMCCVFLQQNYTPLHYASMRGHTAVVDQLIRYGAAINLTGFVSLAYVTQHEKTMLMYIKCTSLHYFNYLNFCVSYTSYVKCIVFPIVNCTISKCFMDTLCLDKKLLKFKV